MAKKRRTAQDYRDDLALLRRYYTGFDSKDGFSTKRLTPAAKRAITKLGPQIKQIKSVQYFPHLELRGRGVKDKAALAAVAPVPADALVYKTTAKRGRKTVTRTVKPQPKQVPVFTTDPKAKISVNKDGSLRIKEHGHVRDVYAIDRKQFSADPYRYMRGFMDKNKAVSVTMNVSSNVIGRVFKRHDFEDGLERQRMAERGERVRPGIGGFATIVEKYREKDQARADSFIGHIGAVSVLRGGTKESNAFRREVRQARESLKKKRRTAAKSKRQRLRNK